MLVPHLLYNNDIVLKRDKARFSEVMWNLVNNGIKFQRKEEPFLCPQEKNDKIPFASTVKDSGSGIDMEHLSKLSIKFVTNLRKVCTTSNVEGSLKAWRARRRIYQRVAFKAE